MATKVWSPDFSKAPKGTIGTCFNPDGKAWWWNVLPEIKGSDKRPNHMLWRGPVYAEGYIFAGEISSDVDKSKWRDSWVDAPKAKK